MLSQERVACFALSQFVLCAMAGIALAQHVRFQYVRGGRGKRIAEWVFELIS